jgi:hypothetical protein
MVCGLPVGRSRDAHRLAVYCQADRHRQLCIKRQSRGAEARGPRWQDAGYDFFTAANASQQTGLRGPAE